MKRDDVYKEIQDRFGFVPTFFKTLPEVNLTPEWELFKKTELEDCPIPYKYRSLLGLAVASAVGSPYGVCYHTEMARANGANNEEIENALTYSKFVTGWCSYVGGKLYDLESFRGEVTKACEKVRSRR